MYLTLFQNATNLLSNCYYFFNNICVQVIINLDTFILLSRLYCDMQKCTLFPSTSSSVAIYKQIQISFIMMSFCRPSLFISVFHSSTYSKWTSVVQRTSCGLTGTSGTYRFSTWMDALLWSIALTLPWWRNCYRRLRVDNCKCSTINKHNQWTNSSVVVFNQSYSLWCHREAPPPVTGVWSYLS